VPVGHRRGSRCAPDPAGATAPRDRPRHPGTSPVRRFYSRQPAARGPDADDDELYSALDAVDAGAAVRALPDGLDTRIGSAGAILAPGVAQQIAIARLVLANPHTLVLDEATSLLNPSAARHLERSLARLLEGRTVIAVSHRLHTANDASMVAVVEDGRITEFGAHDDLLRASGAYAALWRSWQGDDDNPAPSP